MSHNSSTGTGVPVQAYRQRSGGDTASVGKHAQRSSQESSAGHMALTGCLMGSKASTSGCSCQATSMPAEPGPTCAVVRGARPAPLSSSTDTSPAQGVDAFGGAMMTGHRRPPAECFTFTCHAGKKLLREKWVGRVAPDYMTHARGKILPCPHNRILVAGQY